MPSTRFNAVFSVQMGVHEEELLWLAERVKRLKASSGGDDGGAVLLYVEPATEELHKMHVQITRDANGVKISPDAES